MSDGGLSIYGAIGRHRTRVSDGAVWHRGRHFTRVLYLWPIFIFTYFWNSLKYYKSFGNLKNIFYTKNINLSMFLLTLDSLILYKYILLCLYFYILFHFKSSICSAKCLIFWSNFLNPLGGVEYKCGRKIERECVCV